MKNIFFIVLVISVLWIQASNGVKCYVQDCLRSNDSEGWDCNLENEGNVSEDENACAEYLEKVNGKEHMYSRTISESFGYKNGLKPKEGCDDGGGKFENNGDIWEEERCYCFKDFCNVKYKIPDGANFMKLDPF